MGSSPSLGPAFHGELGSQGGHGHGHGWRRGPRPALSVSCQLQEPLPQWYHCRLILPTGLCPLLPYSSKATPDELYEVTRARELNHLLGPKNSSQAFDFILDLHNTTANMGTCFILNVTDTFAMHLCHYLQVD